MADPIDDSAERQKLASRLTVASVAGITLISFAVIYFSRGEDRSEAGRYVMTGVLPLLGQGLRPDPMRKDQINRTVTARRVVARRRSAAGGRRVVACAD